MKARMILPRWLWTNAALFGRLVCRPESLLAAAPAAPPFDPFGPTAPLASPLGTVVALPVQTITLTNRRALAGSQTVFPLAANLSVHRLKVIRLTDLKGPRWDTILKQPSRSLAEGIEIRWLKVASKMPAKRVPNENKTDPRVPPLAMRTSVSSALKVEGSNATLQTKGGTFVFRFTDRTRFFEEQPAALSELKVGAEVMLDLHVQDQEFKVVGLDLLPDGSK